MTPADGGAAGVSLYREIDALGGAAESEWGQGYSQALTDVLAILSRRGFSEAADAATSVFGDRYAATNDVPLRCKYLTNGKPYAIKPDTEEGFELIDNVGDMIYCCWSECAHLAGGNWYEVTADGERVQP